MKESVTNLKYFFSRLKAVDQTISDSHAVAWKIPESITTGSISDSFHSFQKLGNELFEKMSYWVDENADIAKEMNRPVAGNSSGRIILGPQTDGSRNLLVVANRSSKSLSEMRKICALLFGREFEEPAIRGLTKSDEILTFSHQDISWGCGRSQMYYQAACIGIPNVALETDNCVDILTAAVAMLLWRYGTENPQIAIVQSHSFKQDSLYGLKVRVPENPSIKAFMQSQLCKVNFADDGSDFIRPEVGIIVTELNDNEIYNPCSFPVFPLTFAWNYRAVDNTLTGKIWYDTEKFDSIIVDQIGEQLTGLLNHISQGSTDDLAENVALLNEEKEKAIVDSGRSALPAGAWLGTIHELFQKKVHSNPRAPALSDGKVTLSYLELDRRSNDRKCSAKCLISADATDQHPKRLVHLL